MHGLSRSRELLERASRAIPGGINSSVRAREVPFPLFFRQAKGCRLWDADGNEYIDYYLGQGPLILGHSHQAILEAVFGALGQGQLFAGQHELEIEVAERLIRLVPCAERVRFCTTGTEAVQTALRLARAHTGRTLIIKFEGHYHGWMDSALVSVAPAPDRAGPAERPWAVPGSLGQSPAALREVLVAPWNEEGTLAALMEEQGERVAAVIMEPIMANNGVIPPRPGYLEAVQALCRRHGCLLIFDEVITGFRVDLAGAQGRLGVTPDLAVFGKAMASGFPVGAVAGRREVMELMAGGAVNHSGTFNGGVATMAAARATMELLERDQAEIYGGMEAMGHGLMEGVGEIADRRGVPLRAQGYPQLFHLSFRQLDQLCNYRDCLSCDVERYGDVVRSLLEQGVRTTGRGAWYLSAAHTEREVERTLQALDESLREA